ncbi:MAG: peptide ABC transporter substrate-binding protein [Chloroflexi bacterium RBG_16_50_9]|nr:MAG: peptide ABC transporter substrate-binding protein [Chloroflexi bacterium RBG_16_50_9]
METLLEVRNVVKYFPIYAGGVLIRKYLMCQAVDDISFSVGRGECFGIAGESGSGKTTLAKVILLMEKATSGSILFEGKNILEFNKPDIMWYHSRVQTIFQDAASSLDPRMRIREIVGEPLEVQHNSNQLSQRAVRARAEEILCSVGLGSACLNRYPHELSGGQKQRVAIARAIILEPSLVVLDEPVSALDVSIRAQILNLLADIQEEHGLTYIIIAHDLAMLRHITTHIAVMYLGKIVELGNTDEVFDNPLHPYTKALFAAVPRPEPDRVKKASAISGEIGNPTCPPGGCRFHPRCSDATPDCQQVIPTLREVRPGHQVACYAETKAVGNTSSKTASSV